MIVMFSALNLMIKVVMLKFMGQACKIKGINLIFTLHVLVQKLQLMVPGLIGHPGAVVTLSVRIQG